MQSLHKAVAQQQHNIIRPPQSHTLSACSRASHCLPTSSWQLRQLGCSWESRAYQLKPSSGAAVLDVDQARFVVGAGSDADLKVTGGQVAAQHAELQQKGKQVFLKALQGESVFDRTYTWIDDQEARPNVSYVLASGSTVAFGELQQSYIVEFEEPSGSNALVEMMMQGMAASADPEVKKALG